MPKLNSAPTPKQFATAFTRHFAAEVRNAAGRDGRLSLNEATKMDPAFADNALNYLEKKDQKSVSTEKLIGAAYGYALATGSKVAGNGNRISLVEARMLPDDLQANFLALRGKDAPAVQDVALSSAEKQNIFNMIQTNDGDVFPDADDGYYGLHVYSLEGDAAKPLLDFTFADAGRAFDFDASKHAAVATINSFDEPSLDVHILDRATGAKLYENWIDTTMIEPEVLEKHFGVDDGEEYDSMALVVGRFASDGEHLGVVAGEQEPDAMDFADWLEDARF